MTAPRAFFLPGQLIGRHVLHYDEIDSTSSACVRLAHDSGNHGLAVLARAQTAGRGQHGRSWLCRPDAGVLLSVLLFPPPELLRPVILTAWAAVAVCETVTELTGRPGRIKWPNDVLLDGKKVCGILIEQGQGVVAGIGLNVQQTADEFRAAELPLAGSLHSMTGENFETRAVAVRLLHQLDAAYRSLAGGNLAALEQRWRERLGLVGCDVLLETHATTHRGRLLEVGFDGLCLEGPEGPTVLPPERVRHLSAGGERGPL